MAEGNLVAKYQAAEAASAAAVVDLTIATQMGVIRKFYLDEEGQGYRTDMEEREGGEWKRVVKRFHVQDVWAFVGALPMIGWFFWSGESYRVPSLISCRPFHTLSIRKREGERHEVRVYNWGGMGGGLMEAVVASPLSFSLICSFLSSHVPEDAQEVGETELPIWFDV